VWSQVVQDRVADQSLRRTLSTMAEAEAAASDTTALQRLHALTATFQRSLLRVESACAPAAAAASSSYRYTTLSDTKAYMAKHRPLFL
jgi:hypothetical protein